MAPGSVTVDGVVDFAGRKAALGNESLSILEKDGQLWTGRPGSSIANVRPAGVPHELAPLALIDLLSTAEDADVIVEQNPEHPHLTRLRLTMPAGTTADAVDVWLDDAYLRRATLDTTDTATSLIIEQLDVDVAGMDWTRLPSSRRPDAR